MTATPDTTTQTRTHTAGAAPAGLNLGQRTGRVALYAIVIAGGLAFALPFFWMISTSFKPENEVFAYPPKWIPSTFTLDGYIEPWDNLPFFTYYRNTVIVTAINIVGYLASCSLVAFAFARMRFRGRNLLFVLVLSTMMLPGQVTLIPLYRLWAELNLVNTIGPLTIPAFFAGEYTGAFTIFLLRQYMMTIPFDLDDAAKLDGASWFRIYWNIILPLTGPGLGAAAIFLFIGKWNDFLYPLIYLQTQEHFTVPLGLAQLNTRFSLAYQQTMAQTLLSLVPVLVVFFLVQRRYVQGIVITGVKG
jgi:multiple sugar transport system permease protein